MELVDEYRQLPETFRLGGAEELMFAKGDRVRGTDSTDRSLMLIVSGHVAVFPDSRRKWANAGYFNPGLYRFEMHRGDGDMLGELDFLLGAGADTTTPLVVCTSDHLVVLKLHLAANHPTLEPPLLEERIGEENSMLLYEMLARGLATRAIRLDCLIANAHADLVKRDQVTSTSDNQDVLDQGLAALRKEFRIALSQECFMRMSCKLRDGANVSRGCLWFLGQWCQIYVFSEQVFLKLSGGRSVQFLVKSIHSVEAVGSQVTLFLAEEPNSVNFDSGSEKPEKQMINTFQVEMLVQGSSRKQSFDHNAQNFPTFSKFRLGSSAKQSETDSKHTKRDLESRCYETTRLEFFDCGSALAARDMIRKQCAWYERAGVRGESPFGSMSPPRHSVTHSVLASRRRKQSVLMIHADKHQDKFQPDGDTGAATRTIKELAPDSWTASDYFASSFKSLSSGLEAELPGPENIEDIIGDLPQVDFHKGDVILQEGSCDRALYVVVQGFVLAQTADGRVLVRREPGEVFGEVSMYDTGNRGASCSVVAGSITTGVKIINLPAMKRSAMENPLQISRLHRFVARTLAVRAQSQVRRDTVFLD